MSLTALEPFFKVSSPLQPRFRVSPYPSPHGEGRSFQIVLCSQGFCRFLPSCAIPDFGRFCRSRGCRAARGQEAVLAQNLPRR